MNILRFQRWSIGLGSTSLCVAAVWAFVPPQGQGQGDIPGVGELGGPTRPLNPQEMAQWLRGRAVFDRNFHKSDGLGNPEMNADSCRACHQDPVMGGAGGLELNVSRFGNDNGGAGPFTDLTGGQGLSKMRPPYVGGREEHDPTTADVFEQRQTPSILGAGLLDEIFDAAILANEDPSDTNTDGIYGVARLIDVGGIPEVGHFGWKGQIPHLGDFIRDAMAGECGMTTPDNGRPFGQSTDTDAVADPELSPGEFLEVHFFLLLLGPPPRGGSNDPAVAQGEALFTSIGCATCHIPSMLGPNGPVPLYSNLLLHNVMPGGFRGMVEPGAPAGFFQTPPLWGIRHTAPYLHDGRGEDLTGAILAHFGEADQVRQNFEALTAPEKEALILFLEDL
ncbi:MAG: hypothetical protein GY711_14005 [bacterium]|nr:hypothetical protein [bacterium]